jgi:hypothetical protein
MKNMVRDFCSRPLHLHREQPRQHSTCSTAGNVAPRSRDKKLGKWVEYQRTRFKNGMIDQERKRMLDEICFDFAPNKVR